MRVLFIHAVLQGIVVFRVPKCKAPIHAVLQDIADYDFKIGGRSKPLSMRFFVDIAKLSNT